MPPPHVPPEDSAAFTVIEHGEQRGPPPGEIRTRHVHVVKPVQRAPPPQPAPPAPPPHTMLDPKFSRALDLKLRRLQARPAAGPGTDRSRRAGRRAPDAGGEAGERPRFITTVRTGQFLLPPPALASLLGLHALYPHAERDKLVYSYASRPKAVAPGRAPPAPPAPGDPAAPGQAVGGGVRHMFAAARALAAGAAGFRAHRCDNGGAGEGGAPYANVMHDKRVVRGSTIAAHPHAQGDGAESAAARAARTRRRALARRARAQRLRPGTPPPAPGRRHHPIQTEYYLEELFDKGVEMEVGVQTDLFADRPATPVYVPAKTGADAATQIYPGDLFDFDLEVQPILEVLVGKTTEQALAEVAQEEELATLREQQRRYCELRDAERAERARLAAQDARLTREKERRVAEARVAQVAAGEARERAAAAVLVQGYLAELLPAVLAGLRDQGYLMERVQRGVDEEFMPWLAEQVAQEIESIITSRDVITEIVRDVVEARAELYRSAGERETERVTPQDSLTPPSALGEGEEEETKEE